MFGSDVKLLFNKALPVKLTAACPPPVKDHPFVKLLVSPELRLKHEFEFVHTAPADAEP